jgi:hypothetical protein
MMLRTSTIMRYCMLACLLLAVLFAILKNTTGEEVPCTLGGEGPRQVMCFYLGMLSALGTVVFALMAWVSSGKSGRNHDPKQTDDGPPNHEKS